MSGKRTRQKGLGSQAQLQGVSSTAFIAVCKAILDFQRLCNGELVHPPVLYRRRVGWCCWWSFSCIVLALTCLNKASPICFPHLQLTLLICWRRVGWCCWWSFSCIVLALTCLNKASPICFPHLQRTLLTCWRRVGWCCWWSSCCMLSSSCAGFWLVEWTSDIAVW